MHALLGYLHDVGFDRVPKPLGVVDGEEVLSWIPGESGAAAWRVAPEAVREGPEYVAPFRDDSHAMLA